MSLQSRMKALARRGLGRFGYEIRRIPAQGVRPPRTPSAVEHNSRAMRESFYADAAQVEGYLNAERRRFYAEFTRLARRAVPRLCDEALRIADYGCGPGLLLKHLHEASPRSSLHGYDFAGAGLEVARRSFPGAAYEQRDLYDAYPDRYDLILCTEVLEHLERPAAALRNLLGQLAPGGRLLLTVPDGRIDQYAGHIHFWSPESWELFLAEACPGLEVETGRIGAHGSPDFLYACIGARAVSAARPQAEPEVSHAGR